jgi:hypothetical protein
MQNKTLIIYDAEGYIVSQMDGNVREPVGIPFMWIEIPEGKRLVGIDTSKEEHEPIFEDLPKSEVEQLKERLVLAESVINMLLLG